MVNIFLSHWKQAGRHVIKNDTHPSLIMLCDRLSIVLLYNAHINLNIFEYNPKSYYFITNFQLYTWVLLHLAA